MGLSYVMDFNHLLCVLRLYLLSELIKTYSLLLVEKHTYTPPTTSAFTLHVIIHTFMLIH